MLKSETVNVFRHANMWTFALPALIFCAAEAPRTALGFPAPEGQ